jgi:hypothetical protein
MGEMITGTGELELLYFELPSPIAIKLCQLVQTKAPLSLVHILNGDRCELGVDYYIYQKNDAFHVWVRVQ